MSNHPTSIIINDDAAYLPADLSPEDLRLVAHGKDTDSLIVPSGLMKV